MDKIIKKNNNNLSRTIGAQKLKEYVYLDLIPSFYATLDLIILYNLEPNSSQISINFLYFLNLLDFYEFLII